MAALPPVQPPIGALNQFISPRGDVLILTEKAMSLSGDSFDVKRFVNGQPGEPVLKIEGRHMTISGRKQINDMAGNQLFDIVKEHMHLLHPTFRVEDPQGKELLEVKKSFKLVGSKATLTVVSSDGRSNVLEMNGNWRDSSADIVEVTSGAVVARIDRKLFNAREFFTNNQTYILTIAPGVDVSLMVAACIILDELNND